MPTSDLAPSIGSAWLRCRKDMMMTKVRMGFKKMRSCADDTLLTVAMGMAFRKSQTFVYSRRGTPVSKTLRYLERGTCGDKILPEYSI